MYMSNTVPHAEGRPALPGDLAEWVGAVKLMQLALEATDGTRLGSQEFALGDGSPAFPSRMLLTLIGYAYARGIYSSQDIEESCRKLGDFRYLCANDFPTGPVLRRFRRQHWAEIHGVLARLVQLVVGDNSGEGWFNNEAEADARMAKAVAADSLSLEF